MRHNRLVQLIGVTLIEAHEREILRHTQAKDVQRVESVHGYPLGREYERLRPTLGRLTEHLNDIFLRSLGVIFNLVDSDVVFQSGLLH